MKTSIIPKIGQIVIVGEPYIKRDKWKMARILNLPASEDGQVRSAVLQTARQKIIRRPLRDLYPIETTAPSHEEVQPIQDSDDDFEIDTIEVQIEEDNSS